MLVRGPILNPRPDGSVQFIDDGVIAIDSNGRITFVAPWMNRPTELNEQNIRKSDGVICPAFLDVHTHIPQHPIRGRFLEGIEAEPTQGRLVAGLHQNVFPAEGRFEDSQFARQVIRDFRDDTLANGVIGGSAYMTVHAPAWRIALEMLPDTWSVGPMLMNMNCPAYLQTDDSTWEAEIESLAADFHRRVIITDRFAVVVDSALRRRAGKLAQKLGLRLQTHLNEQILEKQLVEQKLYPDAGTYTNVYARDGLLDCEPILAHCVHMSSAEFDQVRKKGASIAHCPTSNLLLGSGVMPLDQVREHEIDYAICTDVGASPTVSLMAEMRRFLQVHSGHSKLATAQEALYRSTLAPARILKLDDRLGSLDVGKEATFVEIACQTTGHTVDEVISDLFDCGIRRVVVKGKTAWQSGGLR